MKNILSETAPIFLTLEVGRERTDKTQLRWTESRAENVRVMRDIFILLQLWLPPAFSREQVSNTSTNT